MIRNSNRIPIREEYILLLINLKDKRKKLEHKVAIFAQKRNNQKIYKIMPIFTKKNSVKKDLVIHFQVIQLNTK